MAEYTYPVFCSGLIWQGLQVKSPLWAMEIAEKLASAQHVESLFMAVFKKRKPLGSKKGILEARVVPLECIYVTCPEISVKFNERRVKVRLSVSIPKHEDKNFKVWVRIKLEPNKKRSFGLFRLIDMFKATRDSGKQMALHALNYLRNEGLPPLLGSRLINIQDGQIYEIDIYAANSDDETLQNVFLNYSKNYNEKVTEERVKSVSEYLGLVRLQEELLLPPSEIHAKKWFVGYDMDDWLAPHVGLFHLAFGPKKAGAVGFAYSTSEDKEYQPSLAFARMLCGVFSKNI